MSGKRTQKQITIRCEAVKVLDRARGKGTKGETSYANGIMKMHNFNKEQAKKIRELIEQLDESRETIERLNNGF